jgi:hypothetical protein
MLQDDCLSPCAALLVSMSRSVNRCCVKLRVSTVIEFRVASDRPQEADWTGYVLRTRRIVEKDSSARTGYFTRPG